jgi:hypothetical protein
MNAGFVLSGKSRAQDALKRFGATPMHAVGLVLASLIACLVSPLWGLLHPWAGWHRCRARLDADGLAALGEVLAPRQALNDYKDGIWRGLFRVHAGSLAFVLLQAPILAIAVVPVGLAVVLFAPVAGAYPTSSALQALFIQGVPALVALGVFTVVMGQHMLAYRILGSTQKPHRLGTCFHATGASWRAALKSADTLASLGLLTVLVAGAGGAFALLNVKVAEELGILVPETIGLWIAVALGIMVGALLLEALGEWSEKAQIDFQPAAEPYSFVDWFVNWIWHGIIVPVFLWLKGPGLAVVCIGLVVVVGVMVGKSGISGAFDEGAWSGLAWFLSCAGILLFLRHQQQKGGA